MRDTSWELLWLGGVWDGALVGEIGGLDPKLGSDNSADSLGSWTYTYSSSYLYTIMEGWEGTEGVREGHWPITGSESADPLDCYNNFLSLPCHSQATDRY